MKTRYELMAEHLYREHSYRTSPEQDAWTLRTLHRSLHETPCDHHHPWQDEVS